MIKFYQIRPCTLLAKQNLFRTTTPTSKTEQAYSETLRKTFARPLHAPYRRMSCCRLKNEPLLQSWDPPSLLISNFSNRWPERITISCTFWNSKFTTPSENILPFFQSKPSAAGNSTFPLFHERRILRLIHKTTSDLRSGKLQNTFCAWAKTILYPFPMKT